MPATTALFYNDGSHGSHDVTPTVIYLKPANWKTTRWKIDRRAEILQHT